MESHQYIHFLEHWKPYRIISGFKPWLDTTTLSASILYTVSTENSPISSLTEDPRTMTLTLNLVQGSSNNMGWFYMLIGLVSINFILQPVETGEGQASGGSESS